MQRVARQLCRQTQCILRGHATHSMDGTDHHAITGQSTGFVENHCIHFGQRLQALEVAHQHAVACQRPRSGQHGHGRRQRQSAGAGNDQYRHCHHERMGRIGRPPPQRRQKGCQQNSDQKRPCYAISHLRQSGFLQRCALHQRHDLTKTGGWPRALHQHLHRRLQVVAPCRDQTSRCAQHRLGLARQQCFIGQRLASDDAAVGRKSFTGQHPHGVTGDQSAHGHALEGAVGGTPLHAIGQSVHDRLQRARRAVAQAQLQPSARQQKENEHGEGVKKHLPSKDSGGVKCASRADHERDHHAQRHRQIHAHPPLADIAQGAGKKRPAGKQHYRQADNPRGPAQQALHFGGEVAGQGHVSGPRIHHDLHHAKACYQPAPQRAPVLALALFAGHGIHGGQSAITGFAHRRQPLRRQHQPRLPDHARTLGSSTDLSLRHAGNCTQRLFNGQCAGCAVHALDDHMRLPGALAPGRRTIWRTGPTKSRPLLAVIQQLWRPGGRHRIRRTARGLIDRGIH